MRLITCYKVAVFSERWSDRSKISQHSLAKAACTVFTYRNPEWFISQVHWQLLTKRISVENSIIFTCMQHAWHTKFEDKNSEFWILVFLREKIAWAEKFPLHSQWFSFELDSFAFECFFGHAYIQRLVCHPPRTKFIFRIFCRCNHCHRALPNADTEIANVSHLFCIQFPYFTLWICKVMYGTSHPRWMSCTTMLLRSFQFAGVSMCSLQHCKCICAYVMHKLKHDEHWHEHSAVIVRTSYCSCFPTFIYIYSMSFDSWIHKCSSFLRFFRCWFWCGSVWLLFAVNSPYISTCVCKHTNTTTRHLTLLLPFSTP